MSPLDEPDATLTLPARVAKIGERAADLGWDVAYVFAQGPPTSVSLRIGNGGILAYGWWVLNDGTVKWQGGAINRMPGGHLPTLTQFRAFVELEGALS